jgi:hypothetical protein
MINQQCIATHSRNYGHTEEDENAEQEGPEFMLQSWVVVAKYQEDDQNRGKAHGDRKAGSKQDSGYHCQWSHEKFPNRYT